MSLPTPQPQPFFVPSDDAAPDHVAWPSIENLGVSYASAIKNRTSAVLHAVLCLQRWWRWAKAIRAGAPYQPLDYKLRDPRKPARAITPAGIYHRIRSSLNLYDASPCCATEKYDGTNVGKSALSRDVLFGRRSTIAASSLAFQKAPLHVVRSYDSVRISEAIVAALLPEQRAHVRDVVLYGELMLGHDKFAYRPRGIESGHWVCFGARIMLNGDAGNGDDADDDADDDANASTTTTTADDVDVARDICQRLREQGFAVTSGLTMFMADKLRELIGDAFPTVNQVAAAPSITDLILNSPTVVASLRDSRCEGVVVSGNNGEIAVKWKSSKEEESQAAALLAQALDIASDRCYRASIAIDDRHLQAMEILRSIAAVLSTPAASASKPAVPKPVKLDPTAVYATELATAYASALTKYDELSVYFAQGDKGIATITNAIITEIRADLEANARNRALVAEATPPNAQELKAIEVATNLYVRRTIGKAVGTFKKGK